MAAKAQDKDALFNNEQSFYGGITLGANASTVDGDGYGGFHKLGLSAGVLVYVPFTEKIGASMSLLYSQKGCRGVRVYDSSYLGAYVENYYMRLHYMEIPAVFHWLYTDKVQFGLGGSYGRLLSSSEELVTDRLINIDPQVHAFKKDDISIICQVAYRISRNLFIDGRFQSSVKTIREWDKIPVGAGYGNRGQYNRVFSFRLVYFFG